MEDDFQKGLVSVIVPIYKVEEYLRECVDSIINQTYKNLEIILVDDGSPDNCGKICDDYAAQDKRITVYHKENGGLSDARNYGIERCHGEFITFVDSDDFLKSTFAKTLLDLLEKYDADLAIAYVQRFKQVPAGGTDALFYSVKVREVCASSHEVIESLLYQRNGTGGPYKLYRRKLFKDTRYPVGLFYEDLATTYKVMSICKRIVLTNEPMYAYRINLDSIMYTKYSPKMLSCIPISRQLYRETKEKYPDLEKAAASRAFAANRVVFLNLPSERKQERKQVWEEMKKYRMKVLFDNKARKRERITALLTYSGFNAFHLFSGLYRWYRMRV